MASRKERYPRDAPETVSTVPKWDPHRYDRTRGMQTDVRYPTSSADDDVFQHTSGGLPVLASLLRLSLVFFLLAEGVRLLGGWLLAPELVPLWVFVALYAGYRALLRGEGISRAVLSLSLVPIVFFGVAVARLSVGPLVPRLLMLAAALVIAGSVIDLVGSHVVGLAAASGTPRDAATWSERFSGGLPGYERRFLFLLVPGSLALIPESLPLLLIVTPAIAALWLGAGSLRAPLLEVLADTAHAIEAFLSYGRRGEGAPTVYRSAAGSRTDRFIFMGATVALLASVLIPAKPYVALLASAVRGNPALLWKVLFEGLGSAVLPVVVFYSAAAVILGPALVEFRRKTA